MTTAFVLSGGGSLGAVQVGMLRALADNGVRPDLLVGTSAGALNAAWVATHGMSARSLAELGRCWVGIRRGDVFPLDARHIVRGLLGFRAGVVPTRGLHRLVREHVDVDRLEQAAIPVHMVAADLLTGASVLLSTGPLGSSVLASAAVPGVFPPVERDGRLLVDGGVARNTGVAQAAELGASVIYVLPTGAPCALPHPPRSAIGVAMHALTLLIQQRLAHEIATVTGSVTIRLLPPLCPLAISAADFSRAGELIDRGHEASLRWITEGGVDLPAPERFLSAHDHSARRLEARSARTWTTEEGVRP